MNVLIIVGLILTMVMLLTATLVYYLGNLRNQFRVKIEQQYPNALFMIEARSFGQQSRGITQVRGAGTLALTSNLLHFQLWVPQRTLIIPLTAITAIETPRSFLGKSNMRLLLKVVFENEDEAEDAIAWQVTDLESIKQQIEQALPNSENLIV